MTVSFQEYDLRSTRTAHHGDTPRSRKRPTMTGKATQAKPGMVQIWVARPESSKGVGLRTTRPSKTQGVPPRATLTNAVELRTTSPSHTQGAPDRNKPL